MPEYSPVVPQFSVRKETDKTVRIRQVAVHDSRRSNISDKRSPTHNYEPNRKTARRLL